MATKQIVLTASFPKRLRQLRLNRDWSQGQLAKKIGVDIQRISKYERGETSPPLELLATIARAFDISVDYLLVGKSHEAEKLKDIQLIERIEALEKLPEEYRETLISVLDSFIKLNNFEKVART